MPDITAARPASGAPIESSWGGEVHNAIEGIQSGVTNHVISAQSFGDVAVTFPRAYAVAPSVVATVTTSTAVWFALAMFITTTGFTLRVSHRDGTSQTSNIAANWVAVGVPA